MSTKKRVTNNLVVMGSAAVVAVYAAGFVRTAEAAQKFAEMSNEHGPMLPKAHASSEPTAPVVMKSRAELGANGAAVATSASSNATPVATAPQTAPVNSSTPVAQATHSITGASTSPSAASSSTATPISPNAAVAPPKSVSAAASVNATSALPVAPAIAPTAAPVATKPATSATTQVPSAAVAAAPTVPAATTPNVPAPVAATAPAPASNAPVESSEKSSTAAPSAAPVGAAKAPLAPGVKYRDGEYYGWGTSRHGDIQAYVEVTEGKVSYVKIAQCLTQYSCGVIDVLPGQVFQRNGPEVDAVSGATQSSIAFYGAVNQALAKAK